MKNTWLLAAIISLLIFGGCTKDDDSPAEHPAQVSLMFLPVIGDQEMQIAQPYVNVDGYPLFFKDLNFYLANIRLIGEDSSNFKLSDIEIFSVRNHRTSATYTIPYGKYIGIAFDLGVPAEMNSPENPDFSIGDFDANHPLSESNGMFWGWLGGYRFFSIEGFCDTVPNTSATLPISFGLHSGLDTLYREIPPFSRHFDVASNDVALISFKINLDKFFLNEDSHIDLKHETQFHGNTTQLPLGIKVANNSAACFEMIP